MLQQRLDGPPRRWHSAAMPYRLISPLLFALDAERAHNLSIAALRLMPTPAPLAPDPALASTVAGLHFPNPVGLAAGYDKEGRVAHKMHGLGFGFAELGTLTPLAQPGNPRPRLFRLVEDGDQPFRLQQWRTGRGGGPDRALSPSGGGRAGDRHQHRREQGCDRPDRRLCHRGSGHGPAGGLSDGQHLLPQHAGPARLAGSRCARRVAGRGDGGAG